MPVTSLYAAILAIIFVALSLNVVRNRVKFKVGIYSKGHLPLDLAIRAQGNFFEYVPFALILMGMIEMGGGNLRWLHITGQVLVASRLMHAFGLLFKGAGTSVPRFLGTVLTYLVLLGCAVWILRLTLGF